MNSRSVFASFLIYSINLPKLKLVFKFLIRGVPFHGGMKNDDIECKDLKAHKSLSTGLRRCNVASRFKGIKELENLATVKEGLGAAAKKTTTKGLPAIGERRAQIQGFDFFARKTLVSGFNFLSLSLPLALH